MPSVVTKSDLVQAAANAGNVSKTAAGEAVNAVFDAIVTNVAKGKRVTVVGFGTFLPRKRKARAGRSPANGKEIKINAKTVPAFAAGQGFKDAVDKDRTAERFLRRPCFSGDCQAAGELAESRSTIHAMDSPLILSLDHHGVPHRWISWQQACFYYAKNLVAWTLGDETFTFYGGISRMTGERSSITAHSIIAIKGKALAAKGFNQVPPLNNRELFRRDRHMCAYCGGEFSYFRLTRDHIRRCRAAAATPG